MRKARTTAGTCVAETDITQAHALRSSPRQSYQTRRDAGCLAVLHSDAVWCWLGSSAHGATRAVLTPIGWMMTEHARLARRRRRRT